MDVLFWDSGAGVYGTRVGPVKCRGKGCANRRSPYSECLYYADGVPLSMGHVSLRDGHLRADSLEPTIKAQRQLTALLGF
jgi:hypothetical protein